MDTDQACGYLGLMNGADGRRRRRGDKMFSKANETATRFGFNLDQSSAGEARWFTASGAVGVSVETAEDFDADLERIEREVYTVIDRDGMPVDSLGRFDNADDAFEAAAKLTR